MKNSLIHRFTNRTLSRGELQQLHRDVNLNAESHMKEIEKDWDSFDTTGTEWPEANWQALETEIAGIEKKTRHVRLFQMNRWMSIAASLTLVAAVWFVFSAIDDRNIQTEETAEMIIKTNTSDKAKTVVLKDGTKVLLTGHSSLSYYKSFNEKYRVVHLNGEAYFKTKDKNTRPFIVVSENITSICRGNEFAITAYENSDEISIVSSSALIEVAQNDKLNSESNKVSVNNCQRYSFSKESQQYLIGQVSDCDFDNKVRSMKNQRVPETIVML